MVIYAAPLLIAVVLATDYFGLHISKIVIFLYEIDSRCGAQVVDRTKACATKKYARVIY